MKHKIFPNFFIIGAPKCGTSALTQYLSTHPNVFMCQVKEPNFFNTDMPTFSLAYNLKDYLKFFKGVKSHHLAVGESSTSYLSSKNAVDEILKFNPDAKFIVLLRNPVNMFFSLHAQFCRAKIETILDARKAWNAQLSRNLSTLRKPYKQFLSYKKQCSLGEQVLNFLNVIKNKNNIKFILFDDLKSDASKVYNEVLEFLSLPMEEKKFFPVVNKHSVLRKNFITFFLSNLLSFFRWLKAKAGKNILTNNSIVGKARQKFVKFYRKFCYETKERQSPEISFIDELKVSFCDDIMLLSKLLNRDLSNWVK